MYLAKQNKLPSCLQNYFAQTSEYTLMKPDKPNEICLMSPGSTNP